MRGSASAVIYVLIAAGGLVAGCDLKAPRLPGGLGDRCGDIMKAAMPFAEIDIGKRTSESPGLDKIIARVEGTRTDLPEGSQAPRDLGAECEFTNKILTAYRWTKGDPQQHP